MAEYYHNLITEKSWRLLLDLKRKYDFILIGGWAVFLWTGAMKSKDIDIVVDFKVLGQLKNDFDIVKNDRLRKYEAKLEEIDLDIYVEHFSNPGIPAEDIGEFSGYKETLRVPFQEILLILKLTAYESRKGTPKGEKDRIDIFSLLTADEFDSAEYRKYLRMYERQGDLVKVTALIEQTVEVPELGLNRHKFSRLKKILLAGLRQ